MRISYSTARREAATLGLIASSLLGTGCWTVVDSFELFEGGGGRITIITVLTNNEREFDLARLPPFWKGGAYERSLESLQGNAALLQSLGFDRLSEVSQSQVGSYQWQQDGELIRVRRQTGIGGDIVGATGAELTLGTRAKYLVRIVVPGRIVEASPIRYREAENGTVASSYPELAAVDGRGTATWRIPWTAVYAASPATAELAYRPLAPGGAG